jgi:branched-chain amino acid transport system ATP-binding protein
MLKLNNIDAGYGKLAVLNDVSMTIEKGEFVALLGSNGAGKTTTIRMILGLAPISGGKIRVCGYSIKTILKTP